MRACLPLVALVLSLSLSLPLALTPAGPAAATATATATAAEDEPHTDVPEAPGPAYCAAVARQCGLECNATTDPGSAGAAACEARCAVARAACKARDALSGVEPWLQDKAEKADRFMEGFDSGRRDPGPPGDGAPSHRACRSAHDQCEARCATRFGRDSYARAGCESVCAMNRATCEAEAGVETARPYIEREVERLNNFFDELLGDDEDEAPAAPAPPPASEWPRPHPDGSLEL
jgi:hypothetical protein